MADFITERDPVIVFSPQPNMHGLSPKDIELKNRIKKLELEHLKLCDELEEMEYLPTNQPSLSKYQDVIKRINSKWQEISKLTEVYLGQEVNHDKSVD